MVRSILGHFHQGCHIFQPYNDMQCIAVALIALLTFMKCANNTSFESRDLDEILIEGTSLYRVIAETTGRSGYLSHNQLPTNVTFRQERYQVSYVLDHFYGTINGEINLEVQQTCFYEAFSQVILLSNFQRLTVNDLTVAIYIDTTCNLFYLFDSHKRDSNGFHSENGASVLLQFDSLDEVLLFLFNHCTGYSYELTPVLFPTRFTSNSPHSNERKRKVKPLILYVEMR